MSDPQILYYLTDPPDCEPCHWQRRHVPATRRASIFCKPIKSKVDMCESCYAALSTSTGWVYHNGKWGEAPPVQVAPNPSGDTLDWTTRAGVVDVFRCFDGRFKTLREVMCWAVAHAEFWKLGVSFEGIEIV